LLSFSHPQPILNLLDDPNQSAYVIISTIKLLSVPIGIGVHNLLSTRHQEFSGPLLVRILIGSGVEIIINILIDPSPTIVVVSG
jgi:putative effector of murein hydrolase LrgA (UPF0299 family)